MTSPGPISSLQPGYRRDEWGAVSFAVFLIVVGAFWLTYPNLWDEVGRFFRDLSPVYVGGVPVFVEPTRNHSTLYGIATAFFVILSLWLFALTGIRLYRHSKSWIVSRTFTRAVFLLGLGVLAWQLQIGTIHFRSIVPLIVVLAGASLVVRGLWNIFLVKSNV